MESDEDDEQNLNRQASQFSDQKKSYKGQVLNGKKDGKGTEINENEKTCYTGYWQQNKYHGEGKLLYYNTNCYYNGIWDNNEKRQGLQTYPNGDQYTGDFKNNQFHGYGILHNNALGYRYEGYFQEGFRSGQGKEFYKNMSFYEGEFYKNEKHGKGKLTFNDGSYYEGYFIRGDPSGYGIHISFTVEQSKTLLIKDTKNKYENQLDILDSQQKEQMLNQNVESQQKSKNQKKIDDDDIQEYCYEGDFVAGYKHGIGRYTEPDGSYYYCHWEFDKKFGKILFYNGQNHKWMIYEYKNPSEIINHYVPPYKIMSKINIIKEEQSGYPNLIDDAYNSKIEECGISGDQFEDPYFLPSEESIHLTEDEIKFLNIPQLDFMRITEHPTLKNNSKPQLFFFPLQISTIKLQQFCDHQLIVCLDALINYPYILEKVFTKKYELDMVCFFTIKLYIEGQWKEIIVDDYIPCYKSNRNPIFASCDNNEYGWYAIQKAFCKHYKEYFYYSRLNYPNKATEYLQILSGLPCKSFTWDINCDDFQKKSNEESIYQMITQSNSKVRICYLREKVAMQNQVPKNYAYNVIDYITLQEEIQGYAVPLEFNFLVIQTLNPDNKIANENESILNKNPKILQILQPYIKSQGQGEENQKFNKHVGKGKYYFVLGLKDFMYYFTELHVLQGVQYPQHNQYEILEKKEQTSQSEFRFFLKFNISFPQEVLINVQQHIFNLENNKTNIKTQKGYKNQTEYYPTRIILANVRDIDFKSKEDKAYQIKRIKQRKLLELQRMNFNQYGEHDDGMVGDEDSFDELRKLQEQYSEGDFVNIRRRSNQSQQSDEIFKLMDEQHSENQKIEREQKKQKKFEMEDSIIENEKITDKNQQQQQQSNQFRKILVDGVKENEQGNSQIAISPRQNILKKENKVEGIFKEKLREKKQKQVAFEEQIERKNQESKKRQTLSNKFLLLKLPESIMKQQDQQKFIKEQVDLRLDNIRQEEQELEELSSNIKRKKQLPYNYIYGQGQDKLQNQCKTINLQRGTYILLIQTEGPELDDDLTELAKKTINRSFLLHFTMSIYAQQLIKIEQVPEPENFCKNVYEQCILQAERHFSGQGTANPFFQKNDLTDREDGCNDLIITQYFLKEEGTFLQYLKNKSADKNLKIWRHKLQFRNENMRIITQGKLLEDQKVDVHLWPNQEQLIIIQQVGALPYNLEGGEGICIIDQLKQDIDVFDKDELQQSQIDQQQYLEQQQQQQISRRRMSSLKEGIHKSIKQKKENKGEYDDQSDTSSVQQNSNNKNKKIFTNMFKGKSKQQQSPKNQIRPQLKTQKVNIGGSN